MGGAGEKAIECAAELCDGWAPWFMEWTMVKKAIAELKNKGINMLGGYWTLGRYDGVMIFEAPSEKDAMKFAISFAEDATVETMVAVPREEALKLL